MEYYGLDAHKLSITYTCVNEQGQVLRSGWASSIIGFCYAPPALVGSRQPFWLDRQFDSRMHQPSLSLGLADWQA